MIIRLTRTADGTVIVTPPSLPTTDDGTVPAGVDPTDAATAFDAAVAFGTAELDYMPGQLSGSDWAEHVVTLHFTADERVSGRTWI